MARAKDQPPHLMSLPAWWIPRPPAPIGFPSAAAAVALAQPLPRVRGSLDPADRRPARSLSGDGQGVLLRPHGREGEGGQGPLRGGVPRLWRLYATAQWQGRRVRLLQGLPSRRDRAALDAGARDLGDARLARALRQDAFLLRLVADPCPTTWRARVPTPGSGPLAVGQHRQRAVRNLGWRARGNRTREESGGNPSVERPGSGSRGRAGYRAIAAVSETKEGLVQREARQVNW